MKSLLSKTDLKQGLQMVAKWDGATCEIISIKNNTVNYKCLAYMQDKVFTDSIKTVLECFKPINTVYA